MYSHVSTQVSGGCRWHGGPNAGGDRCTKARSGRHREPDTVGRVAGCGAAWLARLTGGQEVPGSNPGSPTSRARTLHRAHHHSYSAPTLYDFRMAIHANAPVRRVSIERMSVSLERTLRAEGKSEKTVYSYACRFGCCGSSSAAGITSLRSMCRRMTCGTSSLSRPPRTAPPRHWSDTRACSSSFAIVSRRRSSRYRPWPGCGPQPSSASHPHCQR
jgi:hypothetical protein